MESSFALSSTALLGLEDDSPCRCEFFAKAQAAAGQGPHPGKGGQLRGDPAQQDSRGLYDQAIRRHIEAALTATRGRIEGEHGAARLLDINPHTLRARMRKLGIDWNDFRVPDTPSS